MGVIGGSGGGGESVSWQQRLCMIDNTQPPQQYLWLSVQLYGKVSLTSGIITCSISTYTTMLRVQFFLGVNVFNINSNTVIVFGQLGQSEQLFCGKS